VHDRPINCFKFRLDVHTCHQKQVGTDRQRERAKARRQSESKSEIEVRERESHRLQIGRKMRVKDAGALTIFNHTVLFITEIFFIMMRVCGSDGVANSSIPLFCRLHWHAVCAVLEQARHCWFISLPHTHDGRGKFSSSVHVLTHNPDQFCRAGHYLIRFGFKTKPDRTRDWMLRDYTMDALNTYTLYVRIRIVGNTTDSGIGLSL